MTDRSHAYTLSMLPLSINYSLGKKIRSKLTLNIFGYVHDIKNPTTDLCSWIIYPKFLYQICNSMHIVQNIRQKLRSNVFTQTVEFMSLFKL